MAREMKRERERGRGREGREDSLLDSYDDRSLLLCCDLHGASDWQLFNGGL